MAKAFVALGSNLKEPIKQVNNAIVALSALPNTTLIKASSLYQTAPVGYTDDELAKVPDFINAVAALETTLKPVELLDAILAIEDKAGRLRPYRNAPRVLDCDLLMHDDVVIETKKLTLPHPRMHLRGFVLLPLIEVAPALFIPNHGKITSFITPEITEGVIKLNANQNP
jgi:2-amino-4-hydroxy-6-hydroxymethyldihydropteridine diphosphokinase